MAYGSINADSIVTSVSGGVLGGGNASIMKNRIINGGQVINQRAGGTVNPTASTYTYITDRWNVLQSQSSKLTAAQSSTAPAGFNNSLLITSSSAYSITSTDQFMFSQLIEGYNIADLGWGTASAKTVTLSFWVQSSLTGTFGVVLKNNSSAYTYGATYTISAANTWEYKTITVAGPTGGTWETTSSAGIVVRFGLGVGSTYSLAAGSWSTSGYYDGVTGATSLVGTSGATFYITGVQLEVGSSATGFEYVNYQTSLANCQRYYWKMINDSSSTFCSFGIGVINSSTSVDRSYTALPVKMRAAPTSTYAYLRIYDGQSATAVSSLTATYNSSSVGSFTFTASGAGFVTGRAGMIIESTPNTSAYLDFSAEL